MREHRFAERLAYASELTRTLLAQLAAGQRRVSITHREVRFRVVDLVGWRTIHIHVSKTSGYTRLYAQDGTRLVNCGLEPERAAAFLAGLDDGRPASRFAAAS